MVAPPTSARAVRSRLGRRLRDGLVRLRNTLPPGPARLVGFRPAADDAVATAPVHTYPPLVAELRHLRWTAAGDLELRGWTYLSTAPACRGQLRIWAQVVGQDATVPARVEQRSDPEPGVFTKVVEDLSHAAWTATFTGLGASVGDLPIWVELTTGSQIYRSPLTKLYRWGSADRLPGRRVGAAGRGDEAWVTASWCGPAGLVLSVRGDGVVAEQVSLSGDEILVSARALGRAAPTSVLLSAGNTDPVRFGAERTQPVRLHVDQLPDRDAADLIWVAANGSRHRVLADNPALTLSGAPTAGVGVATSPDGGLTLSRRSRLVQAERLTVLDGEGAPGAAPNPGEPALQVAGVLAGSWNPPLTLELRGERDVFTARLPTTAGAFEVAIPLLRPDPWSPDPLSSDPLGPDPLGPDPLRPGPGGQPGLAPLPGGYRLWLRDAEGRSELVQLSVDLVATLYTWAFTEHFSARLEHHPDGGGLWLMMLDPRALAEIGSYARKRLRARHQKGDTIAEVEDAVYFESFVGESCACNPRAVFTEIARRDLGLKLYWGVQDRSVAVPGGAVAVTINSAEWWRVRHQARYLVTNDWLNDTFKHRAHQRVLQTWHGTAYKLLGLDRPRARGDAAFFRAIQAENVKWDLLLAENAYSIDVMRRAYDFSGPVLESGYPRNDLLRSPEAPVVRARLRGRLGIRDDQQVVLYAPTWREDRTAMVTDLDPVELARILGEEFVILVRGHAKTMRANPELRAERVIDVTTYPEVSQLFCAADVCITDYSSVMFDFTVTGKPLLFFTPDHDAYVQHLRGAYFDLAGSAPGPLLSTVGATAEAVAHAAQVRAEFDERYRAWTTRFNLWDDGSASARAADALLAPGGGR